MSHARLLEDMVSAGERDEGQGPGSGQGQSWGQSRGQSDVEAEGAGGGFGATQRRLAGSTTRSPMRLAGRSSSIGKHVRYSAEPPPSAGRGAAGTAHINNAATDDGAQLLRTLEPFSPTSPTSVLDMGPTTSPTGARSGRSGVHIPKLSTGVAAPVATRPFAGRTTASPSGRQAQVEAQASASRGRGGRGGMGISAGSLISPPATPLGMAAAERRRQRSNGLVNRPLTNMARPHTNSITR